MSRMSKELTAETFVATPYEEVLNILKTYKPDIKPEDKILDPCAGEGHLLAAVERWAPPQCKIIASDVQNRGNVANTPIYSGINFLSEDYPITQADWVITHPPVVSSTFIIQKALSIATKGIIMYGSMGFVSGERRYDQLLKHNPPHYIYSYISRLDLPKNGSFLPSERKCAFQSCWYIWDFIRERPIDETIFRWLPSMGKSYSMYGD